MNGDLPHLFIKQVTSNFRVTISTTVNVHLSTDKNIKEVLSEMNLLVIKKKNYAILSLNLLTLD